MKSCQLWQLPVILFLLVQPLSVVSTCYGSDQNTTKHKPIVSSVQSGNTSVPLPQTRSDNVTLEFPKNNPTLVSPLVENINENRGKVFQETKKNGNPNSMHSGLGPGILDSKTDKQVEAISVLREVVCGISQNPDVYYQLGTVYEKQGLNEEAVIAYKQAIRINPELLKTRLRLAEVRLLLGNEKGALEEYGKILQVEPASPDIQLKMARIFTRRNETGLAIGMYSAVLRQFSDNIDAHREIAILYKNKKEIDKAAEHFKKAIELNKYDKESRNALVAIYGSNKQVKVLIELLKETVTLFPEDFNNHYRLAMAYDYLKDYVHAIESYNKALMLKPDHLKSMNALRILYSKTGRFEEVRHLQKSIKVFDRDQLLALESLAINQDDFDPEPHKINYALKTHVPKKTLKTVRDGNKKKHHPKRQKPSSNKQQELRRTKATSLEEGSHAHMV